jgi:DNA polymerase-3 subunit epsilon
VLRTLIEDMRAPLSSIRASVETMTQYPDMDAAAAAQFMDIIEEQTVLLSSQLEAAVESYATLYRQTWPLVKMTSRDLATVLRSPVREATALPVALEVDPDIEEARVRVDAAATVQMLQALVTRIDNATRCDALTLRMGRVRRFVALDLQWRGSPVTAERLQKWGDKQLSWGTPPVEMTIRDVLDHHDAQMWSQQNDDQRIRILLPRGGSSGGSSGGPQRSASSGARGS